MMISAHTDNGWTIQDTDMHGYLHTKQAFRHTQQQDIGFGPIMDGRGYLTTIGVGRRSIMDAGFMTISMAGFGCLVLNGRLHG